MKVCKWHHTHPVTIVFTIKSFLFLLIIPLIRGIYSVFQTDPAAVWRGGTQYDLLVLFLILLISTVYWFAEGYFVGDREVHARSGIVRRSYDKIPYDKVSSVTLYQAYYLRPLGAVYCRLDTGGDVREKKEGFYLRKKQAELLKEKIDVEKIGSHERQGTYAINLWQTFLLALTVTNYLGGVFLLTTFFNRSQGLIDQRVEAFAQESFTFIRAIMDRFIPKALTTLTIVTLVGGLVAFIQQFLRYYKLTLKRQGNLLAIQRGFVSPRESLLDTRKINYIRVSQGAPMLLLGYCITRVGCFGYGKKNKEGKPVLLALEKKKQVWDKTKEILPELECVPVSLHNVGFEAFFSFFWQSFLALGALLVVACTLGYFLPHWTGLILLFSLLLLIPVVWMFVIKIYDFTRSGAAQNGTSYTFQCSSVFSYATVVIPKDRLSQVFFFQSPFNKRKGLTTVYLYPYETKRAHFVLRGIELEKAREFFGYS